MPKLIRKLWRGRRAASLLEFALVLPLIVLMAGGLWEFGHVYDAYLVATNAAREGARWGALGYDNASIQARVDSYLSTGYAGRVASGELTLGAVNVTELDDVDNGYSAGEPGSPIKVDVPVTVAIFFPGVLSFSTSLDLVGEATMRLETTRAVSSPPPPTPPPCPPVGIAGVSFSPVGNSGKVDVFWTTDVAADSRIQWGLTTGYGSSVSSGSAVTSHSLQMTGIAQSTLYYYEIRSTSSCGQSGTSAGTYTR